MQNLDKFQSVFFQECDELSSALESELTMLAACTDRSEHLHAAFRAIHSIKGGAAMFGYRRLINFAHFLESALDKLREGSIKVDGNVIDKLLHATDILADIADATRRDVALPEKYELIAQQELGQICGCLPALDFDGAAGTVAALPASNTASPELYSIDFKPDPRLLRRGADPLSLLKNLSELGTVNVTASTVDLPELSSADPATLYLSWHLTLTTTAPIEEVRRAFDFVAAGARLKIARSEPPSLPVESEGVGEPASPAAFAQPQERLRRDRTISSIRVDLDRVDKLVDLVAELTISQSVVLQYLDKSMIDTDPMLFRVLSQLRQLTRGLQDGVMMVRAQPVRSVFARMPSVAREVAQATGRRVRLELKGEDTEIDKTVIEQLSDPLVHIIRNAIGHGIEPPEERIRLNKPQTGVVRLSASQTGGWIVIEVSDDGRGINREAVLKRAIDRNLVATDAILTGEEIEELIFAPGLSTAQELTGISGRGVGMDVVLRNIQTLGGNISVRSVMGAGTSITIRLPLSLAVLDGMLVRAGPEFYLIPLCSVAECVVFNDQQITHVPGTGDLLAFRGKHVRALNLARHLGLSQFAKALTQQAVVVTTEGDGRLCLVVDEILGSQQVVIKGLKGTCGNSQEFAGATILGDGTIALILDVQKLAAAARKSVAPRLQTRLTMPEEFAA